MRVVMIGTGYVGLVSGACFADFGHEVTCIDKDAGKIASLEKGVMPIYEPGLDVLVEQNVKAGRLSFSTEPDAVKEADVVFLAVGTPTRRGDGHADLTYVYAAAEEIGRLITGYTVIVTKSTVPVGTGDEVEAIIRGVAPEAEFDVASNPEFLREGAAIEDFKRPDRVVVGAETERALAVLRDLYRPLFLNETPVVAVNRRTAELTKYAANAFLATKIAFINEIADLCDVVGANVQQVAKGIGLDKRIGGKFLNAGPGYGGSCFPKDTLALSRTAHQVASPVTIVDSVIASNDKRKAAMADVVVRAAGGSVAGKTIAVLGLTFKPNTDDMREAPSLVVVPALVKAGARVTAFDPEGMDEAKKHIADVTFAPSAPACLEGADLAVILTEWDQFRAFDLKTMAEGLKDRLLVDLRNIYTRDEAERAGLTYVSVGRPDAGSGASLGAKVSDLARERDGRGAAR
ncbi:UDP-glucose/GDP-mannose dehydrogenase family protein [Acuticoccus sp. I52.16.1]|uniref:UDP-glucose dehydrogenase family protein n=1 Tax=Acuticoccus sp. I52.16.1 TaxID=2928472 RepID=UPI001FD23672|nr:UDP-glucose/GDP-mannose dehydrogenase family protein [Acuticoccus sp. I52.16.1]UOM37349.1 UDP-glucose/GDP-mannose dehydrogenase family protein [Acuticoccus sp. I52.16.1]